VNDALLSGSLDIAPGGTAPFILLWARARNKLDVRAISALHSVPLWFNTRDPDVKRLEDLSTKDKIAVTAPRISEHAVLLEIAASKRWRMKDFAHYDSLTFATPDQSTHQRVPGDNLPQAPFQTIFGHSEPRVPEQPRGEPR
jgi:NitT/TauT family transport system substrate-binding protein